MKAIILLAAMLVVTAAPAEAKFKPFTKLKSLCCGYDRGPVRTILGAPFFVTGFTVTLVADATVVPFVRGVNHYVVEPAVTGW